MNKKISNTMSKKKCHLKDTKTLEKVKKKEEKNTIKKSMNKSNLIEKN